MRSLVTPLAFIAAFGTDAVVRAQDETEVREWPRYHIGVGVGESRLGPDWDSVGVPEQIRPNSSVDSTGWTGWKVVAGFRPTRVVGAEIQYVDFGTAESEDHYSPHTAIQVGGYSLKSRASAMVLTALLFIPDRSPSFDVYGKVGVANLEESVSVHVLNYAAPGCRNLPPAPCTFDSDVDQTNSQPYVGIGARFKVARSWAVRVDYEAIDGEVGDNTTMFSLGIAWER